MEAWEGSAPTSVTIAEIRVTRGVPPMSVGLRVERAADRRRIRRQHPAEVVRGTSRGHGGERLLVPVEDGQERESDAGTGSPPRASSPGSPVARRGIMNMAISLAPTAPDRAPETIEGPSQISLRRPLEHDSRESGRQDLNLRPLDPQSSALPSCATSRCPSDLGFPPALRAREQYRTSRRGHEPLCGRHAGRWPEHDLCRWHVAERHLLTHAPQRTRWLQIGPNTVRSDRQQHRFRTNTGAILIHPGKINTMKCRPVRDGTTADAPPARTMPSRRFAGRDS